MQTQSFVKAGAVVLLAAFAAACSVATAPPPDTKPAVLAQAANSALFVEQPYDPRWWRQFEDPVLEQLETAALDRQL